MPPSSRVQNSVAAVEVNLVELRPSILGIVMIPLLLGLLGGERSSQESRIIDVGFPDHRRTEATADRAVMSSSSEHTAEFSGVVVDEISGERISGLRISIPEIDRHTVSGSDGRFEFHDVPSRSGSFEILVSGPGYGSAFFDETFQLGKRVVRRLYLRPIGW